MSSGRPVDPDRLLQRAFLKQAETSPDASAVIGGLRALTYGEVRRHAEDLATSLLAQRLKASAPVAVVMESGWEVVVAALGILMAGGAYAPVEVVGAGADLKRKLDEIGADIVVTQPRLTGKHDFGRKRRVVAVDRNPTSSFPTGLTAGERVTVKTDGLACVMLRREPNGKLRRVKVAHAQLAHVAHDFCKQTRLDNQDRLVSLDAIDSEAFTCCVFSTLSVGGTVVLPLTEERNDPPRWLELIDDYDVTVWSSTPAAVQRLIAERAAHPAFSLATLRLAALDGDWMPVRLPAEIERAMPGARVAAFHTELDDADPSRRLELLDPVWTSGLYRRRLREGEALPQDFHVLSGGLEDCAPLEPGDLYVGSPSGTPTRWPFAPSNRSSSVRRPNGGEALVRTGYRARLRADGGIEFVPWLDRKTFAVPQKPSVWWARARA